MKHEREGTSDAILRRVPDLNLYCEHGVPTARLDWHSGPICACGRPSTRESGWCGEPCSFEREVVPAKVVDLNPMTDEDYKVIRMAVARGLVMVGLGEEHFAQVIAPLDRLRAQYAALASGTEQAK